MIRRIAAARDLITLLAVTIGVPMVLIAVAGPPLPRRLPSTDVLRTWLHDPLQPGYAAVTACTVAWLLWAAYTTAILTCLAVNLRPLPARLRRMAAYLPPPVQGLTATMLGAAAVTSAATPSATTPPPVTVTDTTTPPAVRLGSGPTATPAETHPSDQEGITTRTLTTNDDLMPATPQDQADGITYLAPVRGVTSQGPSRVQTAAHFARLTYQVARDDRMVEVAGRFRGDAGHVDIHRLKAGFEERDAPAWARNAPGGVHRVIAGDNLWDIAEQRLGDPHRWHEIYLLNRGHKQANGYALSDPDEIHIGWVLALPAHEAAAPAVPDKGSAAPADPAPAETAPGGSAAASPSGPASPTPATPAPSVTVIAPGTAAPTVDAPAPGEHSESQADQQVGITLPSQGWISLGLATTIAAVAALLRLHRRRRARLGAPILVGTGQTRPPVPPELALADAAGRRDLTPDTDPEGTDERPRPGARPAAPTLPAPIGVDASGAELSLFALPGPGLALGGPGADAVARAMLASALATGVYDPPAVRPIVVTTPDTLARLLPDGDEPTGLDPHGVTFDGERLIVLADTGAAVTHAEEEMIGRRRLLDTLDADTITDLNTRDDHIEHQPPYVLLIDSTHRHTGRVAAIAAHRAALHLHPVVLGALEGTPTVEVAADGTVPGGGRLATLAAADLAQLLAMIAEAAARPEPGTDIDQPVEVGHPDRSAGPMEAGEEASPVDLAPVPDLPAASSDSPPLARLTVLGAVALTTDAGPVTTGMRSGSYAALALLAAHPHGRTLAQISADLHPDTDPTAAAKRIRTDINTVRRVLRTATGAAKAKFVLYDPATGRYRIDPDTIEVDLWRMLTAIGTANTATDDTAALTALREAADLYGGDFADGQDRIWVTDYATTHRHQILNVYARIAELLEPDQPDAAVAALETALRHDPVNEELYQRIIRIHGRQQRPDAVRRTLCRLEDQLADLGDAEPSEATRRIADRQLRPTVTSGTRP